MTTRERRRFRISLLLLEITVQHKSQNVQPVMLKYSRYSFLSLLTSTSIPKADKNNKLHCTSINLKYFHAITPFPNLHFLILMKELCL